MTIRKRMLTGWAVALVAFLAGAWALGAPGGTSAQVDLVGIWQQHIDARNAGDVDGALALMTEDAVFQGSPGCTASSPCVGTEAIRAELENFLADNIQITIISAEVTDNIVTDQWESTSDCLLSAGIERFSGSDTVQFTDDKISSVDITPDLAGVSTEQLADFVACAQNLGQPAGAPETGTGGSLGGGGGIAPWWYALVAGGALLTISGVTGLRKARSRR